MTDLREKVARVIDQTAWEPMTGHVPIIRQAESLRKADAILILIGGDGWKPIETAPKDALILLFGPLEPHPESRELYGNLDKPGRYTGYWCEIDEAWCIGGSTWLGPWTQPTHWMPLPASPPPPVTP